MKISIREKDSSFKRITLFLPLSLIKSKIFWKIAINYLSGEEKENLKRVHCFVVECYNELVKIIKKNGHFCLAEIVNDDVYIHIKV